MTQTLFVVGDTMTSAKRRARERAEMNDKILDAARNLFAEQGYDAVSMRKIADAIEYTATTLYSYFESKEAILNALCEREFSSFSDDIAACDAINCPVMRLIAAGKAYVRFAIDHPNHFRFMFMTELPPHEADQKTRDPNKDSYRMLKRMIEDVHAKLGFKPPYDDVDLAAQTLWAAVHGVAALAVTHHHDDWVDWKPIDQRTDAMLRAILSGMLTEEAKEKIKFAVKAAMQNQHHAAAS